MFIFKKIVSEFLLPLPFSLGITLIGLYLLWFTTKQKAGKILVSVGFLVLLIFSSSIVSNMILWPLENRYDVFNIEKGNVIKYIVVLGGSHTSNRRYPVLSQIGSPAMVRLAEGIRLHLKHPGSRLLLSGGGVADPVPNAEIMASIAKGIGVDEDNIVLETKSKDTKDEALFIKPIVGTDPFVLVTSASHMPRSMALFKKLGMQPIPAPVGHIVKSGKGLAVDIFFPKAKNIQKTETALHEYIGLIWSKLRGQI